MTQQTTIVPVRQTVVVKTSVEHAFEVFTAGFNTWWPRQHHLSDNDLAEAVIEPRVGGRWYERDTGGAECDWGRVVAWEPPYRVVLTWAINNDWKVPTDPTNGSEIEVRFTAEEPGVTRVDFEHRRFERHRRGGQEVRDAVSGPQGWSMIVQRYAAAASA
jgi:uncharacterized protein YndB with AHSA1/START domain